MKKILNVLLVFVLVGCNPETGTDKFQSIRDKVIDVSGELKEIDTGEVLIGAYPRLQIGCGYLVVSDYKAYNKLIHFFKLENLEHIVSVGDVGQGPNEITRIGHLELDEKRRKLYVSDHGKNKILSYDIDSLIACPESYEFLQKVKINKGLFPDSYCYVNDTLSYARIIKPTSVSTFEQGIGIWNMVTGEVKMMPYSHPDIEMKRSLFDVSLDNNLYAEVYLRHDLMSICDLDGHLIYNIYGPDWNDGGRSDISCFGGVLIVGNYIMASYSGGDYEKEYSPKKILIFSLEGEYIKTLDLKEEIIDFCYDDIHNRIVLALDGEIQFAYLDLEGLI
ncbi:MAG: 6-bladed beta-propeller [Bacteroides sp]|nr:6-bladed beta-propeller [Bacteroides sp.]